MCRYVAYIGEPTDPSPLIFGGDHSLYEQSWAPRELLSGSVNADGYGVVWYTDGEPRRMAEDRPIWHDGELKRALASVRSSCVLGALRNATPGQPVDRAGLLPLVYDQWSFVLNGFIPDFHRSHMRALRAELPDDLYARLRGSSDAETLFFLAVQAVREGAALSVALEETARTVAKRVGKEEAQMNMLLSDGKGIGVLRSSTVLMTNSMYVATRQEVAPNGVLLASEAIDTGSAWLPVDGHHRADIGFDGVVDTELVFL
jgi:glutamine amidotransferase